MTRARSVRVEHPGVIDVRPVTAESWEAFVRLFEAKGGPHFCWCTTYRVASSRDLSHAGKKACMRELVRAGTPIGVMAFKGDERLRNIVDERNVVHRPPLGPG